MNGKRRLKHTKMLEPFFKNDLGVFESETAKVCNKVVLLGIVELPDNAKALKSLSSAGESVPLLTQSAKCWNSY